MNTGKRKLDAADRLKGLLLAAVLMGGYLLSGHPIGVAYMSVVAVGLIVWFSVRNRKGRLGRERVTAGLCANCGYDLRATPDRCPECGTPSATPR